MQVRENSLYLLGLVLILAVATGALGGGLFNQQEPWMTQWQHLAFMKLCHQMPGRSFWINDQPMAVCSRCLGIYTSFAFGWILLPLASLGRLSEKVPVKKIALFAVLINFFDIIGNVLGFWENTLISRFVFGFLLGCSAAFIFSGDFFNLTIKSTGNHHGRFTTYKQ